MAGDKTLHLTPEFAEALTAMRKRGLSLLACAQKLGVADRVAARWARHLGLSARLNRGRLSGETLLKETERG